MEAKVCKVDVYWTVQDGKRFTISLSEEQAWLSLDRLWAHSENPIGWTVERTTEEVPIAVGDVHDGEGEMIQLDDDGRELSRRAYKPVHVLWRCPHCGKKHNTDLYSDPFERRLPASNPSIWFCEHDKGLVLVQW